MKPSIDEFLFNLSELGIKLWVDNDRLRCNAPKEMLTSALREQLTDRKTEILTFLNKFSEYSSIQDQTLPLISPDLKNRYQPFPLNDMQQAYWLGRTDSFDMGNVSIHSYTEIAIVDLNIDRLNLAWQQLIDRHDMLRAIVLPDGQQQILPQVPPYEIEVLDLRGKDAEAVAFQIEMIRDRLSHQVLPLEQWPQFEILASRLDEHSSRLHLSIDGWCLDGRSLQLLFRELKELYDKSDRFLPTLELSFRDYVLAAIALENSPIYEKSLKYWLSRIPTLPPAPELPLAQNPSNLKNPRFVSLKYKLESQTVQKLTNRAAKGSLTLAGTLLAVYAEVMGRWSKNPRFTINVPRFNRLPLHPQVNDIMGELVSFTLLEIDNSGNESFEARSQRIQSQLWQDLEHDYVTGVRVLRELAKVQGKAGGVAMPIVFTTTPQDVDGNNATGDIPLGKVVYNVYQTPQIWIDNIYFVEADGSLTYTWQVVDELFPAGMIKDMFDAACSLLQRLADEENTWQQTAPQLIPSAQLEQRAAINNTATEASDILLHSLFATQVKQRSKKTAVATSTSSLSYQELFDRSNQVGHRLRQLGVLPNKLVAIVMDKGWEQIVAVMGILTAGAAYVPIDPGLPEERLFYLLENSQVEIVLTQSWLKEKLAWREGIQLLCLDNEDLAKESKQPLEPVQTADDLAYVIYTSGSTGQPKGVMITHRNVVNVVIHTNRRFNVSYQDSILAVTALNHDLSVYDIFGLLSAGGSIVMPDAEVVKDPSHWVDLMLRERVTLWNSVPAMMEMLVSYVEQQAATIPLSLRLAILGGDWLPISLPDRLKSLLPNIQILSIGGPTETTIWNIGYLIENTDPNWKSIPYGQPMANAKYYILNESLEDCPVWVPGQMYCAGVQLAKGYWQDEEKTKTNFITHPRTGERIYRTGDLGRYLPDSNIEFLGRVDFQIKIRGQRIETGEIEAALTQHPNVKASVVTVVGNESNQQRLVAYIVPKQKISTENKLSEAYEPGQLEGVLIDPVERIEFKLKQLGLRQIPPAQHSIELPKPEFDEIIKQAYLQRQSYRQFLDKSISLKQLGEFLSCLLPITLDSSPLPKYRYASAGGLYPVQAYLYVKPNRVEGLESGFYYYNPTYHRLVFVSAASEIDSRIYQKNQLIFEESAFSIFLIGQLSAIAPMYGEVTRDFCMLEAGYISQLLMETAPKYKIGLCPIGSIEFEQLRDLLAIESSQILLHNMVGGGIDPSWTKQWLEEKPATFDNHHSESLNDELRDFLQQKLPEYMIPSAYVLLDALPLTRNGKVDRLALSALESLLPQQSAAYVEPVTDSEQLIAGVWQQILQLEKIGINDNFFELGGNSLLMVKTQLKLQEILGKKIPIVDMFKAPTISSLLKYLNKNETTKTSTEQGQERGSIRSDRQTLRSQKQQSRQKHRGQKV
ncbi:amino acid adenylation domain-containing protein [Phormidium nigroviride]